MSQQMSMNRVIHGAFRRDLGRFDQALDAFPAGSRSGPSSWVRRGTTSRSSSTIITTTKRRSSGRCCASRARRSCSSATSTASTRRCSPRWTRRPRGWPSCARTHSAENAPSARATVADLSTVLLGHLEHEESTIELRVRLDQGHAADEGRREGGPEGAQGQHGHVHRLAQRRDRAGREDVPRQADPAVRCSSSRGTRRAAATRRPSRRPGRDHSLAHRIHLVRRRRRAGCGERMHLGRADDLGPSAVATASTTAGVAPTPSASATVAASGSALRALDSAACRRAAAR